MSKVENNQEKSNHGGKREGAGRKKGTTDLPKIKDNLTTEQIEEITKHYFERAKDDNRVLTHLIDHIYGKPKQALVGGDEDDNPIAITGIQYVTPDTNTTDTETT